MSQLRSSVLPFVTALTIAASQLVATGVAHADEVVQPGAGAPAVAVRSSARPFGMMDLEPTSSLGVSASLGGSKMGDFRGNGSLIVGELTLDGELAIGGHIKLFASQPISYVSEGGGPEPYGRGNFTGGAMVLGGAGPLSAATGVSISLGGSEFGQGGMYLRHDVLKYESDETILRGFADLHARLGGGFVALQLDYAVWEYRGGETGWGTHDLATVTLGGAMPVTSDAWAVADVALIHYFSQGSGGSDLDILIANAGLRWRAAPDSRATWGARTSVQAGDGFVTVAFGAELRADFLALGAAR